MDDIKYLKTLVSQAGKLAESCEIILLTSNNVKTTNEADYANYSIKAEFLSDQDEKLIVESLHNLGFTVRQFYDEEAFIAFISGKNVIASNIIVINSAQKGTKIGRKSLIPAVCDLYGIRYTGSNPYVVSLCRDKYRCGCILAQNEIQTPNAFLYQPSGGWYREPPVLGNRWIIKPNYEAASIGIDASNICLNDTMYQKVIEMVSNYHQEILIEEFIAGYEVEVPVIVSKNRTLSFFSCWNQFRWE